MASVWGGGLIHFPHVLLEMSRSTEAKPNVRAQTASELQTGFD